MSRKLCILFWLVSNCFITKYRKPIIEVSKHYLQCCTCCMLLLFAIVNGVLVRWLSEVFGLLSNSNRIQNNICLSQLTTVHIHIPEAAGLLDEWRMNRCVNNCTQKQINIFAVFFIFTSIRFPVRNKVVQKDKYKEKDQPGRFKSSMFSQTFHWSTSRTDENVS